MICEAGGCYVVHDSGEPCEEAAARNRLRSMQSKAEAAIFGESSEDLRRRLAAQKAFQERKALNEELVDIARRALEVRTPVGASQDWIEDRARNLIAAIVSNYTVEKRSY